jgi:hypothetical protein
MRDTAMGLALIAVGSGIAYLGFSGNLPTFLMAIFYPQYVQVGG